MGIDNSKSRAEYTRISWRSFVMTLPGGVAWLRVQCKLLKFKENLIGPPRLHYPDPNPPPEPGK